MASRLQRLLKLDAYLLGGGYPTLQELCDLLGVKPRTVYLDLRELKERFGREIMFCKKNNGYHNVAATSSLPGMAATDDQLTILLAAVETLSRLTGPKVKALLLRVLGDLCGDRLPVLSERISGALAFPEARRLEDEEAFIEALMACINKNQLTAELADGEAIQFEAPYRLNWVNGQWVICGMQAQGNLAEVPLQKVTQNAGHANSN